MPILLKIYLWSYKYMFISLFSAYVLLQSFAINASGEEKDQYEWLGNSHYRIETIIEVIPDKEVTDKVSWIVPAEIRCDEDRILRYYGLNGQIDEDSIYVIAYDKNEFSPVVQNDKFEEFKKYIIPHRIFYRDLPEERKVIVWNDKLDNNLIYFIYFDIGIGPRKDIYQNIHTKPIGGGESFLCHGGFLDVEFISSPLLIDWDGDDDLDILATSVDSKGGSLWYFENVSGIRNHLHFIDGRRLLYTDKEGGEKFFGRVAYDKIIISEKRTEEGELRFSLWLDGIYKNYVRTKQGKILFLGTAPGRPFLIQEDEFDWDKDGEPEIISLRERQIIYNKDSISEPLRDISGNEIEFPELLWFPQVIDVDGDGNQDIIVGSHSGFIYVLRYAEIRKGKPVFYYPERMIASWVGVTAGSLSAPEVVDWDNDGDYDLLLGSEYGTIFIYENTGDDGSPVFSYKGLLHADGKTIEYPGYGRQAADCFWGYAVPRAIDYDRDGLFDLVISESRGFQNIYRNIGSKNIPKFTFIGQIKVDGKIFKPVWRVQPAFCDWNKDGSWDMICADDDEGGYMALYLGSSDKDIRHFMKKGYFSTYNGEKIHCSYAPGEGDEEGKRIYGRTKYLVIDWDGDGKEDILTREMGYFLFYKNISNSPDNLLLDTPQYLKFLGDKLILNGGIGTHEDGFSLVDWDKDGKLDLISGGENGKTYFFRHESLFSTSRSQMISVQKRGEMAVQYKDILDKSMDIAKPYYMEKKPKILFIHPEPEQGQPEEWYHPEPLKEYYSTSSDLYGDWLKLLKADLRVVYSEEGFYEEWTKRNNYDILIFSYHAWIGPDWLLKWIRNSEQQIKQYVKDGGSIITSVGRDEEEVPLGKIFNIGTTNKPGIPFLQDGFDVEGLTYTVVHTDVNKVSKSRIEINSNNPLGEGLDFIDTSEFGDPSLCEYGFTKPLPGWVKYIVGTITDVKKTEHPVVIAGEIDKGKVVFYTAELLNPENLQVVDGETKVLTLLQLWRNMFLWIMSDKIRTLKVGETIYFTSEDNWSPKEAIVEEKEEWTRVNKWCRRTTLNGTKGTPFLCVGPNRKNVPDIYLPLRLEGIYDILIGVRRVGGLCNFNTKLSSEERFFTVDPGVGEAEMDTNLELSWKKSIKLDGTEKVILRYAGEHIYFDYLKCVRIK